MRMKKFLILALATTWSIQALAVGYVQNGGPTCVAIVNLTTGYVTICPTYNAGTGAGGACVHASTLNITGVGGVATNVQINPVPAGYSAIIITNLTNGAYVRCGLPVDSGGNWIGACSTGTAF